MPAEFSIIVPTYKEAKNLPELVSRIAALDFSQPFELIIVDDDSQDGTEEIIETLRRAHPWIRLMTQKESRSLSKAVITGLENACYSTAVVMDADLSHPPEKIPAMLIALSEPNTDLVIGSRYVKGGTVDESWPLQRKLVSRFCALLARIIVPVRDPLSGFIAIKKELCFSGEKLDPISWKIGLELMMKCNCRNIKEVPIHFSERKLGKSKLNFKEALNYFRHLGRLMVYKFF